MLKKLSFIIFLCSITFFACSDLSLLEKEKKLISYFENDYSYELGEKDKYVVLSYNIQRGFKLNQDPFKQNSVGGSPEHLELLVEAVNDVNPDFVALQDVARNVSNTLVEDQVRYIANLLEMNFAYADYSEVNTLEGVFIRGTRGHAFLTKYDIKNIENTIVLNQSRYTSRSCFNVAVEISDDKSISFLGIHFRSGASTAAKKIESDIVLEIIEDQDNPVILLGDFNNTVRSDFVKRFTEVLPSVLSLASLEERNRVNHAGTFGASGNSNVIDNILVDSTAFDIQNIGIMDDRYWDLSDHRYLFASFSF